MFSSRPVTPAILLLSLVLTATSCDRDNGGAASNTSNESADSSSPPLQVTGSAVPDDLVRAVTRELGQGLHHAGPSWYGIRYVGEDWDGHSGTLQEYRFDPLTVEDATPLTQADKLNGILESRYGELPVAARIYHWDELRWGEWIEGTFRLIANREGSGWKVVFLSSSWRDMHPCSDPDAFIAALKARRAAPAPAAPPGPLPSTLPVQ